jgi:L-2,4-diaminobutyric acid acetyltransferase
LDDAPWIWRLVRETGVLDENSSYLYLLLCQDFAETCVVAEQESQVVGFVTAYRPPVRSNVLFVWQVGVSSAARRQGLALRMLNDLVARCRAGDAGIEFVEATVASSNIPSRRLFESLASSLDASLIDGEGFRESHFRFGGHEAEPLIRIGPLNGL